MYENTKGIFIKSAIVDLQQKLLGISGFGPYGLNINHTLQALRQFTTKELITR
jgi:hypothetical protein